MSDADDDAAPNQKFASVTHPIPRDPAAYRTTAHFGQRLRERVPADHRDRVVRETIRYGWCSGTTPPNPDADGGEVWQHFAFEWDDDTLDARWRVVVGIVQAAFVEAERTHLAVTIVDVDGGGGADD